MDKTDFIREWWEADDKVTLITRPRRFGKTLNMSMLEKFFSVDYQDRGELFRGLRIWEEEKYRKLQGTYPVIFLSLADIKETSFEAARSKLCQIIQLLVYRYEYLLQSSLLGEGEKSGLRKMIAGITPDTVSLSLKMLSECLYRHYGKKVIILLDEYDTPMQEAYVGGYWDQMADLTRSLFNSTFKTNPCLERAVMTGITRISKESMFSDLNNLEVTITTNKYEEAFGFTEEEVYAALDEQVVFNQLDQDEDAVWSLLLASGYLKAVRAEYDVETGETVYSLQLTNLEVQIMFRKLIKGWFGTCRSVQNEFLKALLSDTVRAALRQIEEKNYQADLLARGIPEERIRKYGFAFCKKKVLIGR